MEIEVKEWVRLKDGRIRQFKQYVDKEYIELTRPYNTAKVKDIVKHSKNIIDLVEVGDYVNGKEVIEVREQEEKIYLMTGYVPQSYIKEEIKSIVTHEQFKSIEYKVEEDK